MRLLFDVSTTLRAPFAPPVGTTRVERTVLADLYKVLGPDNLTCVNYDDGRFVHISSEEMSLVREVIENPGQQAVRPAPEPALAPDPRSETSLALQSSLVRRFPVLRSLARGYIRLFPEPLRGEAGHAAWTTYSGLVGTVRVSARALRTPRPRRRDRLSVRRRGQRYPSLERGRGQAFSFSGYTDLITIGNGWDYFNYANLHDLKTSTNLRMHGFVHDLIAVEYPHFFHNPDQASVIHQHYAELCHLCETLVCNSEATRQALLRFIADEDLPKPRLAVARLPTLGGSGSELVPSAPADFRDESFVLFVSTIEARKNHGLLLSLWRECLAENRAMPKLVFVGRVGWGVEAVLKVLDYDPVLRGHVRVLHDVSDQELAWLYDHCLFTVYPSFIEGWGLPIAEALGRGRICVHAADPAQKEASQGLMPSIHPEDFAAWKATLLDLIGRQARRARLEETIRDRFKPITRDTFCAAVRRAIGLD